MGSPRDSRNAAHPDDWERQREQLSALVDGELSAAERAALERHVAGCAECQAELAQLRQVRALLRALPPPAVPRSFALPSNAAQTTRPSPSDAARQDAGAAALSPIYRASRWVGGIAASLGLALLLGSGLIGLLSPRSNTGAMMSNSAPVFGGASSTSARSTQPSASAGAPEGTSATTVVIATPSPVVMPGSVTSTPPTSEAAPLAPLAGAGLLAGGVIVLVAGSATRRRRRTRR